METISIEIPASTYVRLYNQHGESVRTEIIKILENGESLREDLLIDESSESPPLISYRPGPNTITGRVWDVADRLKAETGQVSREAVVSACMEEGIKMNTASTQFSQWKKEIEYE